MKVTVTKDKEGIARAELFGVEKKEKVPQKKAGVKTSKKEAEAMIEATTDIITTTLKGGGEVGIAGFGAFSAKTRA